MKGKGLLFSRGKVCSRCAKWLKYLVFHIRNSTGPLPCSKVRHKSKRKQVHGTRLLLWSIGTNTNSVKHKMKHKRNTSGTQAEHLPIKERIEEVKNKRNINNTNVLFVDPADDEHQKNGDYQSIMDEWNSLPVKSIVAIRGKRLAMLRARIKDYGYDDVLNAIKMIRHSPFLLGQNKQGWQIYFDWFIKPNNFLKVLEGNYDDRQRTAPTGKNDMQAGFNEAMRILNLEVNDG